MVLDWHGQPFAPSIVRIMIRTTFKCDTYQAFATMPSRASCGRPACRKASQAFATSRVRSVESVTVTPSFCSAAAACEPRLHATGEAVAAPLDELVEHGRVQIAERVAGPGHRAGEGHRATAERLARQDGTVEGRGNLQGCVEIEGAAADGGGGHVEQPHGDADIDGPGHVGLRRARHTAVGEDLGEPQAAVGEHTDERLVEGALDRGRDDAEVGLVRQRDARLGDAEMQVVGVH